MSNSLILLALLLTLALSGLGTDLFVILLKGSEILASLRELTLLHTFSDVPMYEGTLGVHEIELVVDAGEHLRDGGGVGDHAHGALHLGEVATGNHCGGLVVDSALEASGAPVHELDGTLGLDGGHGGVHVLGDDVTAVHQAAGHVLAVTGVALGHHGRGLEHGVGDLGNGQLLVVSLLRGNHGGVRRKHEMDARVGGQVGLELGDVHVERTVETERRGQGGDDLSDETVQVGVGRTLDVQGAAADIVDRLVVKHDGNVGVLEQGVGGQHAVVGLDNGGGHLGGGVDGEPKLGLLAVVHGQALQQQGAETGAGATAHGVEAQEALESSAVVRKLAHAVEAQVNDLLADGVVTTGEVVGGVLLAGNELLGVEQLTVGTGADLVDHGRLEIEEDAAGHVLAGTSLREEGVESVVTATDGLVGGHLSVGLDAMLEAVKLPAGVSDLDTGLANVDGDNLTHG
mmetsp:Transcript_36609/g.61693  ORF Transcript_36609/g.61693 Transcript_36609/m.61693 type:complete len:458 (+) Transcript_36609:171-1544(+)